MIFAYLMACVSLTILVGWSYRAIRYDTGFSIPGYITYFVLSFSTVDLLAGLAGKQSAVIWLSAIII